jgi:hypothetical protein
MKQVGIKTFGWFFCLNKDNTSQYLMGNSGFIGPNLSCPLLGFASRWQVFYLL